MTEKNFNHWRPHPWHGINIGPNPPTVIHAYIEITPFAPANAGNDFTGAGCSYTEIVLDGSGTVGQWAVTSGQSSINYIFSDDYLFSVIEMMNAHPFDVIPVISHTPEQNVIGIVTTQNIMDLIALEEKKKN